MGSLRKTEPPTGCVYPSCRTTPRPVFERTASSGRLCPPPPPAAIISVFELAPICAACPSAAMLTWAPPARWRGTNQVWRVHGVADVHTEKPVLVGQNPVATAVSADQKLAYIVNQTDAMVSIVDTNANSVVATVAVGATPSSIALSAKWWDVLQ